MANFLSVFLLAFCAIAISAFPNARRSESSDSGKAFVLYHVDQTQRCVDAPSNDVCDLGYKIRYMSDRDFRNTLSAFAFDKIEEVYKSIGFSDECVRRVFTLLCRNAFPECLPEDKLNYGDQDGLIDEIQKCAGVAGESIAKSLRAQNFMSGEHKDPLAHFFTGLDCVQAEQDDEQKCPKPEYPMMRSQKEEYYEKIRNISKEMEEDDNIPVECYKKAFDIFACSYAFCSPDKKELLFKYSKQDCLDIKDCLKFHGKLDDEKETFLDKACSEYPTSETYKQVKIPY
ncbi:uncharacterized protein LOC114519080 [Dendronephthya gigantea]|uniref:uncharacterized protein LOC114519080 n=1 Tax=Dendronephthya gigantea TaxID=151771 RepID=UPI0010696D4D|nr:uncharacterized protein LOC114519080 [Dendronephthya gigantea]